MFFKKQEKKRHPFAGLTVFSLAAVGVMSIFGKIKSMCGCCASGMKRLFRRDSEE